MQTLKERILYLRDVKKLSFYQIGVLTGICRKRAARIYQGCAKKNEWRKRGSLLDAYRPMIANWFSEYPSLKALQVYRWLRGGKKTHRSVRSNFSLSQNYPLQQHSRLENFY